MLTFWTCLNLGYGGRTTLITREGTSRIKYTNVNKLRRLVVDKIKDVSIMPRAPVPALQVPSVISSYGSWLSYPQAIFGVRLLRCLELHFPQFYYVFLS